MMAKGIKRRIAIARENVSREISALASYGKYGAGLAGEGYFGGYRDALDDVFIALNGVIPQRHGWWEKRPDNKSLDQTGD